MGFIHPQLLWLLVAIVPLIVLWSFLRNRRDAQLARFVVKDNWPLLNRSVSTNARLHKGILLLLALSLSIVAAARPYWGTRERQVKSRGVNVIFALDVSKSMLATDILPSRLEAAKRIVRQVLPEIPGNRVGVMPFAGDAFLQCPLTTDYGIVQDVLRQLDSSAVSYPGTNLPEVIRMADAAFDRSGGGSRALVIVSDAENHEDGLDEALEVAAKKGMRVYTLGIGTGDGAPIILPDGSYKEDRKGVKVLTRMNDSVMRTMAEKTDGNAYIAGAAGRLDPSPLIRNLQSLSKDDFAENRRVVREERYQWPLALALLCLLIEPLIGERKASTIRKTRPAIARREVKAT